MNGHSTLDLIFSKIRLSHIVGKDVRLTLKGEEFEGCCPFHKEKTPSFRVNDKKGLYYCFGCQAKGNALTYLQHTMPKKDALELLAQMANVKLHQKQENISTKTQLHLYRQAADFFKSRMTKTALDYLLNRGIHQNSIDLYELGFCPSDESLYIALEKEFSKDMLDQSELFMGRKCRFRDRLMFPIKDTKGNIIAFGGRVLDKSSTAKYINSKETPWFKKSETLYGLFEANKKRKFILVEGYLDVIKVNQSQEFSAVAPLGTSFSKEQAEQIWTYDEMPLVCFDGDTAGQKAAYRLVEKMAPELKSNKSFSFLELPAHEDADSFSSQLKYLTPLSFADKLFKYICLGKNLSLPEHQAFVREKILDITSKQEKNIGQSFKQYLQNKLWLFSSKNSKISKAHYQSQHPSIHTTTLPQEKYFEILGEILLATLINHPILLEDVQEYLGRIYFKEDRLENLKIQLLESYFSSATMKMVEFLNFEKLESYAPFIKPSTPLLLVKESWMDVWHQYIKRDQTKTDSWETIRHLKLNFVIGEHNG